MVFTGFHSKLMTTDESDKIASQRPSEGRYSGAGRLNCALTMFFGCKSLPSCPRLCEKDAKLRGAFWAVGRLRRRRCSSRSRYTYPEHGCSSLNGGNLPYRTSQRLHLVPAAHSLTHHTLDLPNKPLFSAKSLKIRRQNKNGNLF